MHTTRRAWHVISTIAVTFGAAGLAAQAQDANTSNIGGESADTGTLQEVTVTARRQSESLLRVPVAVSVVGEEELNRAAVADLGSVSRMTPQLIVSRAQNPGGASFVIRGIGTPPLDIGLEQSVAVNLDGMQLSRGKLVAVSLFDMQQVEVLKGPQALFFGKNSPAGVISVTSAGATRTYEAMVRVGYEWEAAERLLEGHLSGPLTDTLRARLAFRGTEYEGWMRNHAQPMENPFAPDLPLPGAGAWRSPGGRTRAARLTLEWSPLDELDVVLKTTYSRTEDNDPAGSQPFCAPGIEAPTRSGVADPTGDCRIDRNRSSPSAPPGLMVDWPGGRSGETYADLEVALATLSATYRLTDTLELASVTGYYDLDFRMFGESTHTSLGGIWHTSPEYTKTFSQELRLSSHSPGPLNFMLGAYFETSRRRNDATAIIGYFGPDPATGRHFSFLHDDKVDSDTYSLFGQLRWNLRDDIELAAGARWTKEDKAQDVVNAYRHPALDALLRPPGDVLHSEFDDTNVSPEVTVTWYPGETITLYAAYKTGYKSGGFASAVVLNRSYTADNIRFRSEKARGGEIGFKGELLDRSLRADLTAFHYEYEDLQVSSYDAATISFMLNNAARARTQGLEASLDWAATDVLRLWGRVGYTRARYEQYANAPCYPGQTAAEGCVGGSQDLSGRPLPRAPEITGALGASYNVPVGSRLTLGIGVDAEYSDSYFTQENLHPHARQASFWRLNGSIRLFNDNWELALTGRNLTDEYVSPISFDKSFGQPGEFVAAIERPREVHLRATMRFD